MKKLKFYARWQDGVFNWKSPGWVKEQLAGLEDCDLVITMEKDFGQRTTNQNKYYWGCIIPLVSEGLVNNGYKEFKDIELVHEYLKKEFLTKKVVNENTGEFLEVPGSTAELSTKDFNQFVEDISQWSSEWLGITIPEPNTQSKLFAL